MCENSASFWKGKDNTKVALVFLCPGQAEEIIGRPVCGTTGAHLEALITVLMSREEVKDYFPNNCRYSYRIINLSETVYYKGGPNGDKPASVDICDESNISRIVESINEKCLVIMFVKDDMGAFAKIKEKIEELNSNLLMIQTRHLSSQSINQIKVAKNGDEETKKPPYGNLYKRLKIIAEEVVKQFNKQKKRLGSI